VTPLLAQRPRGADRSFERLYKKHLHAVYRYTLAVLHNEADAEDATQTTFLSATAPTSAANARTPRTTG
jgi:DNA-directed RNA polymerase specialized sigma24 family protein